MDQWAKGTPRDSGNMDSRGGDASLEGGIRNTEGAVARNDAKRDARKGEIYFWYTVTTGGKID